MPFSFPTSYVNVDAELAYWTTPEQNNMLVKIVEHLKNDLEQEKQRALKQAALMEAERARLKALAAGKVAVVEVPTASVDEEALAAQAALVESLSRQLEEERELGLRLHDQLEDMVEELEEVTGVVGLGWGHRGWVG